ncbi:hypothetical protein, partial [Mesorhizobium sp. WSM4884]|uniref:hypothetical protein n=1 Tax=Mesorhizobium sp. WSM4884 TaxID=3038542 RepID=UPI00241598B6
RSRRPEHEKDRYQPLAEAQTSPRMRLNASCQNLLTRTSQTLQSHKTKPRRKSTGFVSSLTGPARPRFFLSAVSAHVAGQDSSRAWPAQDAHQSI